MVYRITMADSLEFDKVSGISIEEEFVFEEEIQRPDETRFFTLEDQLLDYFERVLPKKKHISKFEYMELEKEVERIRKVYNKTVTLIDAKYMSDLTRKSVSIPWVVPIASDHTLKPYSYEAEWAPLYDVAARQLPNFYPRMISALPRPYSSKEEGNLIRQDTIVCDEEGVTKLHAQGNFIRSKSIIHEDGKISVESIQLENTGDDIKTKGFFLEKRGVDIPKPLAGHDFFDTIEPHKLLTDKQLIELFPTIETILTHGVPETKEPYTEGLRYLKPYDVSLEDISWNLWSKQFPPEEQLNQTYKPEEIKFEKHSKEKGPSEEVQKVYKANWTPGVNPRLWLMSQEDNGNLIVKMLLSEEGKTTRIPPTIIGEKLEPKFTSSTPDECLNVNSFEEFLQSGVYSVKNKVPVCVPVSFINQEKPFLYSDKIAWVDTTGDSILKHHQATLHAFQPILMKQKPRKYEAIRGKQESEIRKDIRIILRDETRLLADKASDIDLLVRELSQKDKIFVDSSNLFVVCGHTLSQLKGDLEANNQLFFEEWTSVLDGSRVCKYCGEQVTSDVFIAQDDFDEKGQVLKNYDALDSKEFEFHGQSFTNSLLSLKQYFDLNNPSQSILYLLLSLLQVMPTKDQLKPILDFSIKLAPLVNKQPEVHKGAFGIALMVTLLQIHDPFLIPRRSFGSKILKLSGYPRDTSEEKTAPALDTIVSILKSTFEATPNTFTGPIKTLFKQILVNQKEVRKVAIQYLKLISTKDFKTQFQEAAKRYSQIPVQEELQQLGLPLIAVAKNTLNPSERLGEEELMGTCLIYTPKTFLSGFLPPSVTQKQVKIFKSIIHPTKNARQVIPLDFKDLTIRLEKSEITKNVSKAVPAKIKSPKLHEFLKSNTTDGVGYTTILQRCLDFFPLQVEIRQKTVHLQSHKDPLLFRDSAKALLLELLHGIKDSEVKQFNEFLEKDLTIRMGLLTPVEAEKQNIELRAQERETFKQRMRSMDDEQRETTKMLLDIGIASFIITNEDRRRFAEEYNYTEVDVPDDTTQKWDDNEERNPNAEVYGEQSKPVDNGDYGGNNNTFGDEEAW